MNFQVRRLIGVFATSLGILLIARGYWRGQPTGLFPYMLLFIGVIYLLLTWGGRQDG